jgi:hypothetical protein
LPGELTQKIALIHSVFEGLLAINEDHWDFVGEPAAEGIVRIHVNLLPAELLLAGQLFERFLHDFAEVATPSRIENDLVSHRGRV